MQHRLKAGANARRYCAACVFASIVVLAGCGGGGDSSSNDTAYSDPVTYSSGASASLSSAKELSSVTHHQVIINGVALNYTATAGHLTASDPASDAAHASFFYVAYTLDGQAAGSRPLTIFYNGGPGSASLWLHLGSFAPVRLETGTPSTTTPTPYALQANSQSLLDVTDMVFVDAVGTGFSQAIAPNTNQTFWGVDADAVVFRDFITRYLAVNHREDSPLYLFGESYGTTRSAVLADELEVAGVPVTGVILQSSVLNYNVNCAMVTRGRVNCGNLLPSYGAAGAWHGLADPSPPVSELPAFMDQMRTLADAAYTPAVATYLATRTPISSGLVATLVARTGLGFSVWQASPNMSPLVFQVNLVPNVIIGLYDARVSAPVGSTLAQGDPSSDYIEPGFSLAVNDYLANGLGYTTPSSYAISNDSITVWSFRHDGAALPDTVPDLAAAMTLNPSLRVLSLNGYHDLLTPFYQTEHDLARLGAQPNIATRFYAGGHMTYLDNVSLAAQKADLAQFYRDPAVTR